MEVDPITCVSKFAKLNPDRVENAKSLIERINSRFLANLSSDPKPEKHEFSSEQLIKQQRLFSADARRMIIIKP